MAHSRGHMAPAEPVTQGKPSYPGTRPAHPALSGIPMASSQLQGLLYHGALFLHPWMPLPLKLTMAYMALVLRLIFPTTNKFQVPSLLFRHFPQTSWCLTFGSTLYLTDGFPRAGHRHDVVCGKLHYFLEKFKVKKKERNGGSIKQENKSRVFGQYSCN